MAKNEAKSKSNKKAEQPKGSSTSPSTKKKNPPLPYLLDFSFSLAGLIILLVGVVTYVLSLLNGVSVVMAALRGCVAVFALGAVFWLLNYFLANQVIQTASKDLKTVRAELEKGESTREVHA